MQTRPLARADLVTGVVLVIFGLWVLAESYGMPRLEERRINPWTVPGLVPGMLGVVVALLGGALALRSLFAGALRARSGLGADDVAEARASMRRLFLCTGLCVVYAVLLVGRIPFWFATGLFVFVFIAAFEWHPQDDRRASVRKLAVAAVIAIVSMVVIPYAFDQLFLVRLP
jgi:putative tricarboxylic transport membrane protein